MNYGEVIKYLLKMSVKEYSSSIPMDCAINMSCREYLSET